MYIISFFNCIFWWRVFRIRYATWFWCWSQYISCHISKWTEIITKHWLTVASIYRFKLKDKKFESHLEKILNHKTSTSLNFYSHNYNKIQESHKGVLAITHNINSSSALTDPFSAEISFSCKRNAKIPLPYKVLFILNIPSLHYFIIVLTYTLLLVPVLPLQWDEYCHPIPYWL